MVFASSIPTPDPYLAFPLLKHLTRFKLVAFRKAFAASIRFLESFIRSQPSLDIVILRVIGVKNFELSEQLWVSWEDKEARHPNASFGAAWAGVKLDWIETQFWREDPTEEFEGKRVGMVFAAHATVTPEMGRELALQSKQALSLFFYSTNRGNNIRWSDWASTVEHFKTELKSLKLVFIGSSLTSTATLTTTLACSSTCYSKLAASHPSLHLASELVGGYTAVWKLLYHLNSKRLEQLAPMFKQEGGGTACWAFQRNGRWIVNISAEAVDECEAWSRFDDHVKLSTEEKVELCACVGCGEVKDGKDPISALKECGVEEVRAALVAGGFDLDAFDSRSPTEPIDQDSFETLVRSTTTT